MIDLNEVIDGLEYVNDCIDKNAYYNPKTKEIYYSNEFFKNAIDTDVKEAIEDIKESYEMLICLPNKVVIKIEDKDNVDTIVK